MKKFTIDVVRGKNLAKLKVGAGFTVNDRDVFIKFCGKLLDSKKDNLIIDLTSVQYISSSLCAPIFDIHFEAKDRGKLLTVLCNEKLETRFAEVGIAKMLPIRVM